MTRDEAPKIGSRPLGSEHRSEGISGRIVGRVLFVRRVRGVLLGFKSDSDRTFIMCVLRWRW